MFSYSFTKLIYINTIFILFYFSFTASASTKALKLNDKILSTIEAGGEDVFYLNANKADLIVLRIERGSFQIDKEINLLVTIYRPDGSILEEINTANDSSLAIFIATSTGAHTVKVRRWNGAQAGSYSIIYEMKEGEDHKFNRLTKLVDYLYDSKKPGAAIAIVQNDKILFEKYLGKANLEYNVPVFPSTGFDLASLSKMFTAYGIALLINQKTIARDDNIRKFIPEFPQYGENITIHHLVHNLSGIKEYEHALALSGFIDTDHNILSQDRILRTILSHDSTYFDPGMNYRYSNSGYIILAEIISRSTGTPFHEWMNVNVFAPLKMNDTYILKKERKIVFDQANSYKKENGGYDDVLSNIDDYKLQPRNLEAIGASQVVSSGRDMIKWAMNYQNGSLGGDSVLKIIDEGIIPQEQSWDWFYGFQRYKYKNKEIRLSEGLTQGFRTYFCRLPEKQISLIYLTNDGEWRTYYVARKLLDLFLTEELPRGEISSRYNRENDSPEMVENKENPKPKITSGFSKYIGTYYNNTLNSSFNITEVNKTLRLKSFIFNEIKFEYSAPNVFTSNSWYMSKIEFEKNTPDDHIHIKVFNNRDSTFYIFKKLE